MPDFIGYPRPDGSAGVRNHVIVLGVGPSGFGVGHKASRLVRTAVPVSCRAGDEALVSALVHHPNVAGFVLVGENLEGAGTDISPADFEKTGKPHETIDIRGMTLLQAVTKTSAAVVDIAHDVSAQPRVLIRLSKLVPGLVGASPLLLSEALSGFLETLQSHGTRCVWVRDDTETDAGLPRDLRKRMAGRIRSGAQPGRDPGIYTLEAPDQERPPWTAVLASGVQVAVACCDASHTPLPHPLIPAVRATVEPNGSSPGTWDVDLGSVVHGRITTENAGLLLLSEIIATASGRLTRDELVQDAVGG